MNEKLYLKVGRLPGMPTYAWFKAIDGERSIGNKSYAMQLVEAAEFSYAAVHPNRSVLGAGGSFEYRAYDLLAEPRGNYAVVRPLSVKLWAENREYCRVVNLTSGKESALFDSLANAQEVQRMAEADELKGSFC